MGFGLICAGFSTLLFMRLVPVELFGFFFVYRGLGKLSSFNSFFRYAKISVYPILVFSLADAVLRIPGISDFAAGENVQLILTDLHRLCLAPFLVLLMLALRCISAELGYKKGASRAVFALSVTFVYYLSYIVSRFGSGELQKYLSVMEMAVYIIMFLAVESAVYACYRAITTDEAEKKEEEKLKQFEERFGKKKSIGKIPEKKGKTFRRK